ncbi:protein-L-isoaspartate O-methyltransferase [Rickettsiales bacterium]|nr:protein-L-isoaspartate O-methyltransferase [Rickettsiales bacterium]
MVENQIRPNKVSKKPVLEAFEQVPRHLFVPREWKEVAYTDHVIPVSGDHNLLPPHVFARMIEAASIDHDDNVLDLFSGTGYSTSIISLLANKVVAIEDSSIMASIAHFMLNKQNIKNSLIISTPPLEGHVDGAPYDSILINIPVDSVPANLFKQLKDGGRLVAVIKNSDLLGTVTLYEVQADHVSERSLFDVTFFCN